MRRWAPIDGGGGRAASNTDLQIARRVVDRSTGYGSQKRSAPTSTPSASSADIGR
jgi:hypothetical protein